MREDAFRSADQRYFWHPFTQMKEYAQQPTRRIDGAEGVWLIDQEGNRLLDGISSWWVNLAGHRNPHLDAALKAQVDRFSHVPTATLTHAPAVGLAEGLAIALEQELPPGLTRTFYSDDGSTAVETALKLVYQSWVNRGKPEKCHFVALEHAYHGDTLGAVGVGNVGLYHQVFRPLLVPALYAPCPSPRVAPPGVSAEAHVDAALAGLEHLLETHLETLAGVIVEPLVQAAVGMYFHPPRYLQGVRALCDRLGLPLIADEVAVGFGRTGRLFACGHAGIRPDVICLSKALTGGYLPMGVTVATEALFETFWGDYAERKTFFHGHSYTGNPLGCALGLEVLRLFREEGLLEHLPPRIRQLQEGFARLGQHPQVGEVRGLGLIAALELFEDPGSKQSFPLEKRLGYRVSQAALSRGLYIRPLGDVLYLLPPLTITEAELDFALTALEGALREVLS